MPLLDILVVVALVASGLVAGIFLPFSTFLIRTFRELTPAEGMRAMQSINRTIVQSVFLPIFLITAALCVAIIVFTLMAWTGTDAVLRLIASALYVVGAFGITVFANVPRNNALAAADPNTGDGERAWSAYLADWVPWNHLRTVVSVAACALFGASLAVG
jgi:uncharacterized membrane protein